MLMVEAMLDWICAAMPGAGKVMVKPDFSLFSFALRGIRQQAHVHAGGAHDGAAGLARGIKQSATEAGAEDVDIAQNDGRATLEARGSWRRLR